MAHLSINDDDEEENWLPENNPSAEIKKYFEGNEFN